jgi:hypothetical protein
MRQQLVNSFALWSRLSASSLLELRYDRHLCVTGGMPAGIGANRTHVDLLASDLHVL